MSLTRTRKKSGDQVRIPRAKGRFEQGFLQNWSDEVFVVVQCVGRVPPVYKVKDVAGETLDGTFYSWELQQVMKPMDTYFKIEKIIDQREENRGNKEILPDQVQRLSREVQCLGSC